jgi:putative ABC transport system permease protein
MTDIVQSRAPTVPGTSKRALQFVLMLRLAVRELRGGVSGFGILIACIALGVAVIAGVGSLTSGLLTGFSSQGRVLIGGDIAMSRVHQRATVAELKALESFGSVAEVATMRAMARTMDDGDQTLIELKGVGEAHPLVGRVRFASGREIGAVLGGNGSAAVGQTLLDRLGLKTGDRIRLGTAELTIADVVLEEPDKFGGRFSYGPRVLVSIETLLATGLVQPGTILDWNYAIAAPNGAELDDAGVGQLAEDAQAKLSGSGFLFKDRRNPSERVTTTLKRLQQFLTLLGLTALLLGGIGVANAVSTYIGRRRQVIATYRSLGATSLVAGGTVLVQLLALALVGVLVGVLIGALLPVLVSTFAGKSLPFPISSSVDHYSLAIAAIYGLLVALAFILWPLSKAFTVRPAQLFRDALANDRTWPGWRLIGAQVGAVALLTGFAVLTSGMAGTALGFIGGTALIVGLFWLIGTGVGRLAGIIPRPRQTEVKLALTNIAAPGGLTRSVIISLGAGLSLLVGLALVDHSMVQELRQRMPDQSPNYYALDIPRAEEETFRSIILQSAPDAVIKTAPMLRGRIVQLNGVNTSEITAPADAAWVLRGDRGLTYSDAPPEGSNLVEGSWWARDYSGEPLVSFGAKLARQFGLGIGDTITVNILGRNVTARIANLREIDWESLTINFIMVFSPNTLAGAPHNLLATVRYERTTDVEADRTVARGIVRALPTVTLINVKEAIGAFEAIFEKVMIAVRIAGSITLLAGALVLAGALAAAHSRRTLQAVILKAIGATRRRLLLSHAAEYAVLTLITGLLAILFGSAAAWIVTTFVLKLEFAFSASVVLLAIGLAATFIFLLGGYRTWRILSARPVPYLRGQE